MEDKHEEVEDTESVSGDSFVADSDDDAPSISGQDDELHIEEHLTEEEIEELVAEFLEVESKAAEAQEALEAESLAKVEGEVREELAQTLCENDLEVAVKDEMTAYRERWEAVLDELETESAHLLEQLDGAGIELPSLYRWIENQAPNGCCTEAWKKRAQWVGSQVTSEMNKLITDAEEYLQTQRPVRRRHGKLLEEGASGFLQKKLANDDNKEALTETTDLHWSSVNKIFSGDVSEERKFGGKHWASVYLASTPQQAAAMGLKFPGVDQVEEIEDIEDNANDPFIADAIANERELALSKEQSKKFRKVKEEDDANIDRKLQLHLKRRWHRKRSKQGTAQKEVFSVEGVIESDSDEPRPFVDSSNCLRRTKTHEDGEGIPHKNNEVAKQNLKTDLVESSGTSSNFDKARPMNNGTSSMSYSSLLDSTELRGCKRSNESEEPYGDEKHICPIIIDCDEEANVVNDKSVCTKLEDHSVLHENAKVSVTADYQFSQSLNEKFFCTACQKVASEVYPHPLMKVIICKDCKSLLERKMHVKDADCSECFCGWCGRSNDLISCKSCNVFFCTTCVERNISEACLSEILASSWQCCCCSPSLLQRLTLEFEKAIGFGDLTVSSSESDSESSDADNNLTVGHKRKRKKKIRRILDDAELGEETKRKIAIEKERQECLKSLQVQFSATSKMTSTATFEGDVPAAASTEVIGDANTGYIVNVVREKGEEAVRIPPSISAKLKAHQVVGIRFMWENIVQSIRKVKSGDKGLGCILAHTMGLGKTFQVIAFLYTAMRSIDLGLRTALIVTPVNVLHNWKQEFMKWRPTEVKPLRVFMLEDVSRERRAKLLAKWRTKGGVFLIGYAAFRNLSFGKHVKDRQMAREICRALQDGPDILVCDEAHMIKNTRADTTQALKQVKCQRRIALTGSPLQNNLMEYYCLPESY